MSDELHLSDELLAEVHNVILKHDKRVEDPSYLVQYFAACIGFTVGKAEMQVGQKQDFINQLKDFALHVMQDVHQKNFPSEGSNDLGVKMWKPK